MCVHSLLWNIAPPPQAEVEGLKKPGRACKTDFPDSQPPQESYWQGCRVPPLAQRRRLESLPGRPGCSWAQECSEEEEFHEAVVA